MHRWIARARQEPYLLEAGRGIRIDGALGVGERVVVGAEDPGGALPLERVVQPPIGGRYALSLQRLQDPRRDIHAVKGQEQVRRMAIDGGKEARRDHLGGVASAELAAQLLDER